MAKKILHATPGMGAAMSEDGVRRFLAESRLNAQVASIDDKGDPVIQPVWFYYDAGSDKIYIETNRNSKKVTYMRKKPSVYFSIDDENPPYRGVKGKGIAAISEDPAKNLSIVEKICTKYLGGLDDPLAKMMTGMAARGESVAIEITPRYYSTWDFGGGNT